MITSAWIKFFSNKKVKIIIKNNYGVFFFYEFNERKRNKRIRINNYFLSTKTSRYFVVKTSLGNLGYHKVTKNIKKSSRLYVI